MPNLNALIDSKKAKDFVCNINKGVPQIVLGCNSVAIGQLCSMVSGGVFVAKDLVSSGKIAQILSSQNKKVKFLTSAYENNLGLIDKNLQNEFYEVVNSFVRKQIDFLIVLPDVLLQKIPTKAELLNSSVNFEINKQYKFQNISAKLVEMGYERTDYIFARGQFTIKGDVVQITPINTENIIKLEFFDDEVEKISEISYEEKKYLNKLNVFEVFAKNFKNYNSSIINLSENVFFDEPKQLEDIVKSISVGENFINPENAFQTNAKSITAFASIRAKTFFKPQDVILFQMLASKSYVYNYKELASDINFYKNSGKTIYLFCENNQNKERLEAFLEQNFVYTKTIDGKTPQIILLEEFLPFSANFLDSDNILIGTYELFKKQKTSLSKKKSTLFIPKINDYVVHETHGIGKCVGLEKLKLTGYEKDYLIIEYAGGDRFYLPSEQADSLSAYSTNETSPKLNKLGGVDFARVKEKVYKNVKELAFDLLELYAKRENAVGHIYVKDDYLMEQFENAFAFDETPDQLRAISDIKADMEGKKIMDRLVCGDVGYGKTEVALRAIYKAILSGYQVAFLCPTTILAEQHYKTCLKRFNGFMVKSARFNRLMPKVEEKAVLSGIKSGEINVVCGTHKLLSKNVEFKNLGLLVLDEEQRFGVEDKEKIKNLKNNIDVLSLSATPIPRTLHMSLTGIRDISIIDTPPKEREPIQTFVTEYDEVLIKRALAQEFARGGQVLIIYNRIDKIYDFAKKINNMFPKINVGVAHGRLSQKVLEDTILKLYSGEYNVLVSTTLIENGVDIPTANTLIVIDADKLGLSQAYQIRGRIGRSNKKAYAYFMYNPDKQITNTAYQRLSALMENTSLGSGFKIAMADLEIRGAGNVLGKEQHGNMLKVGYDLYYKLLASALKEIKGEKVNMGREVKLDIPLDAFIPQTYIESDEERVKIITEISDVKSKSNAEEIKNNLRAVYGKVPKVVENLITLALIRHYAMQNSVKRILVTQNTCHIYFYENKDIILNEFGSIEEKITEVIETLCSKKK